MQVMIADDDQITRSVLRTILQDAGYDVCAEAANGADVLHECNRHKLDVLFLDINMPAMNGFEVLQQIRSVQPDLHVVMISASSTLENVRTAAKYGVNGFVVKPFTPDKVLNSLKGIKR